MQSNQQFPKARKRFGQNFLQDQQIISDIIAAINPRSDEHLVEIGPGRAALTEYLVAAAEHLDVIELDRDLVPLLKTRFKAKSNIDIHEADALSFDYRTLVKQTNKKLRVVGNLPYNITTPLLFHLLGQSQVIEDMCFMLQKEVVERICAQPDSKAYGRLSIMMQYQCETTQMFVVPPEAFDPKPKVDSAIVYLKPHAELLGGDMPIDALNQIVTTAFSQRRKTLSNTLKSMLTVADLTALDIDPKQRPETLTVEQYVALTKRWLATQSN